ncbi:hypothetical protein NDU88_005510 [Pleurodeles waltl]|uniref:Uncharacterized protein n=1 Tax=Pleurodeles waltl TaxID=8319 RepID=A0AAV7SM06_PLEWA|nr:hypothetical protein NDU88_005510 [Pleurodeles waltl]
MTAADCDDSLKEISLRGPTGEEWETLETDLEVEELARALQGIQLRTAPGLNGLHFCHFDETGFWTTALRLD